MGESYRLCIQASTNAEEDPDIDGQGEAKRQTDVLQSIRIRCLCETVMCVLGVSSARGSFICNLRADECYKRSNCQTSAANAF